MEALRRAINNPPAGTLNRVSRGIAEISARDFSSAEGFISGKRVPLVRNGLRRILEQPSPWRGTRVVPFTYLVGAISVHYIGEISVREA